MARSLASIQRIISMDPIPGADKIMHAGVLGWKCITAIANGFNINDLAIYIEIDSKVDEKDPRFAFLEKKHFKVKTMKMRGVYSQGLIMPLKDFPEIKNPVEGMDVTSALKITKIETDEPGECSPSHIKQGKVDKFFCKFAWYRKIRPIFFPKKDKGWPAEIPHTDETRIQAIFAKVGPHFPTKKWYITTKIDGQSATYYYKKKALGKDFFGIYSRELRKREDDPCTWSRIAKEKDIKTKLSRYDKSIWIQGEIAGPGIQKNKNKFTELRFFVFNIYIVDEKRYINPREMITFCSANGLEMVPLLQSDVSLTGGIDELVEMSKGVSEWSKDDLREGIVIREMNNYDLSRISFKVINPDFLIKYNL